MFGEFGYVSITQEDTISMDGALRLCCRRSCRDAVRIDIPWSRQLTCTAMHINRRDIADALASMTHCRCSTLRSRFLSCDAKPTALYQYCAGTRIEPPNILTHTLHPRQTHDNSMNRDTTHAALGIMQSREPGEAYSYREVAWYHAREEVPRRTTPASIRDVN